MFKYILICTLLSEDDKMEAYTSPFKYVSSELKLVKFNYKNTPFNLFAKLYEKFDYAYILESDNGPEKLAA
ncbi:MAG: hypothetical protein QXW83_03795 [Nitrososphaerales archaeon]